MPIIKCTLKLAKMIGVSLEAPGADSTDDWHANVFTIDRRRYVLFCSDETRFCCLAGPVRKRDVQDLGGLLRNSLAATLRFESFGPTSIVYCLERLEDPTLAKSNNRSVLGTINDNQWHIEEHAFRDGGVDMHGTAGLVAHVNHMPLGPLDYGDAINEFRKRCIRAA